MDTLSEPQFVQPRRSPLLRKQKETVNGHEVVRRSQYLDDSDPDSSEVSLSAASSRSFQSQNSRNVAIDNRTGEDIAIIQRQTRTNSKSGWKAKQKWTTDAGTKLVGTADPILWAPVSTTDTDDKGWIYTNGVSRVPQLFEDQHSKNCDKLHTVRYRRWHMLTLIERRDDLDPVPLTTEHETKYLLLSVLRGYDLSKISGARTLYRMSKKHEPLWTEFFEDQAPIQP
ncbi:hypothetical protein SARC_05010 [Sphaeroforma arctica JP610]|uniref:Uncharacterized protein n=1 Tax=Sphaeroforma arctica JP610 TaxID=667725 RepID=A0A0L0G1K0_9EUKA|nr:hypothetical protein SARC_05010 [Sphaeroforma arctica JP610]KNC82709.1 hypothetical protein SARC_05010 [Sphaeroforma arctica JP610]|eukprot:XP_014156611.1 hypothetical protein SARC_05010 [Sphaeroforma arctica JP610]